MIEYEVFEILLYYNDEKVLNIIEIVIKWNFIKTSDIPNEKLINYLSEYISSNKIEKVL